MKKKSLAAIILVIAMLFTACGTAQGPQAENPPAQNQGDNSGNQEAVVSEYPEYLNLESAYPVVKDEYADEITLTAAILMQDNAGDWEDLWINKYFKEKYNINLEVEYLTMANLEERKSLMLNTGELPDMLINMGITTDEIMKYGVDEGLFLQMDQYMNETLTPGILKYLTGSVKAFSTAQDGHVYSMPYLSSELSLGNFKRIHMNRQWLTDLGLEMPRTLDEFVDAMYAIKEADPAGVGSDNLYPFGSGDKDGFGNGWYLLNALGYVEGTNIQGDGYGIKPALRDGEVVIPVYDMEVFQEYLKIMNQFYNDGIINPTFFTIEEAEMQAQVVEGKTAVYHNAPFTAGISNVDDWESCYPLTSEWQTEAEIAAPSYASIGNFVISADTEYPELCMKFAEIFFNNETDSAAYLHFGPHAGDEWCFEGYVGQSYNEETGKYEIAEEDFPEGCTSDWQYLCESRLGNVWQFGTHQIADSRVAWYAEEGHEYQLIVKGTETGNSVWYNSVYTNMEPYVTDSFPTTFYLTAEQTETMNELITVIDPYVREQVAMFITGRRPLSETDDFVEELEGLGINDMLDIYKAVYETVK